MAAVTAKFSFTIRDSQGRTAKTDFYTTYDPTTPGFFGAVNNVLVALAPVTNGFVQAVTSLEVQPITYGTNAAYASAQDKMVLLFQDTLGNLHRFAIPAPKTANFAADGITVVNSGIAGTLITAITSNCTTRTGLTMTYLSGWFTRARNVKRTSSLVKIPAGTGQAVP